MNRTGLFVALSLALVIGLVFGIFPELDLKLASLFYDAQTRSFPLKLNWLAQVARGLHRLHQLLEWQILLCIRRQRACARPLKQRIDARVAGEVAA